ADADPARAGRGDLANGERRTREDVDGPGRDGAHDRADLVERGDTGRVQAFGAGAGVRLEAADGFLEIGAAAYEALRSAGQQHAPPRAIDRLAGGADPFDCEIEIEERVRRVAGGVFD